MSEVQDNIVKGGAETAGDKGLAGGRDSLMQRIYDECASKRLRADADAKTYEKIWYDAPEINPDVYEPDSRMQMNEIVFRKITCTYGL